MDHPQYVPGHVPLRVYELALHQPAPVIHYMHNYRSGCLNGVFYRDGAPCFSCQGVTIFRHHARLLGGKTPHTPPDLPSCL